MIALGDGIEGLFSIPKGTADLILTDLPSGQTKAPFDKPPNLRLFWHAAWQALKPDGIVIAMASSLLFAAELIRSTPYYRYDLIWEKSLSTGFLNAHSRPLRSHEFILCFFRFEGTYNPQMWESGTPIRAITGKTQSNQSQNYGRTLRPSTSRAGATDRFPTSVLHFNSLGNTDPSRAHPQQKPDALLRHLICTYSNPAELVVDPYGGSGSTEYAALAEGRRFLGWDSDERFGTAVSP